MAKNDPITVDEEATGIPHAPGAVVNSVVVEHPDSGEKVTVYVPADHDGSAIKVEFPDGATAQIEGFDPAEQAQLSARVVVPCGECGSPQALTQESFVCSACGSQNTIELKVSGDAGVATATEG